MFTDTGAELPETYSCLRRFEAIFGLEINRLTALDLPELQVRSKGGRRSPFDVLLNEVYSGFLPNPQARWCTRMLKIKPFEHFVGGDEAHAGGIGLGHAAPRAPGHGGIEGGGEILRAASLLHPDGIGVMADDIVEEDQIEVPHLAVRAIRGAVGADVDPQPRQKPPRCLADVLCPEAQVLVAIDPAHAVLVTVRDDEVAAQIRLSVQAFGHLPRNLVRQGLALRVEDRRRKRRHTVPSLAGQTGLNRRTLQDFLEAQGFVSAQPRARSGMLPTFDAVEGERLAELLRHAVPVGALTRLLNASRPLVQLLMRLGLLPQLHDGESRRSRSSRLADGRAVAELLARLEAVTCPVDKVPGGVFNLVESAQIARVTLEEILPRLFRGKIERAFRLKGNSGLGAVHLDPEELRPVAPAPIGGLCLNRTWLALRVNTTVGRFLIAERDGGALLRSTKIPSPRTGKVFERVLPEDLAVFMATFATHAHLCRESGLHHQEVRRRMERLETRPVVDPEIADARLYRRSEIPATWHL